MFEATVLSSSEDENEEVYHLETEVITVRLVLNYLNLSKLVI